MLIEHVQKVCDAYDWADPRIDDILRRHLRLMPSFQRKQWEFAMIYHALDSNGALGAQARGIAFGAGRERLIYALSNRVRHVLATDLYGKQSAWVGARTHAPKEFLLDAAPFDVDPTHIDAAYMDMRTVDYVGEPVDFCYSSCAFEHIGTTDEHFLEHLRGVSRVLKPDGLYVLTTELRYGPTLPVPHNFFFSIEHLIDLAMRSGLAMDPVFDARLATNTLNAPNLDGLEFGLAAAKLWQPSITPWRQGIVFTSALLVLRKLKSVQRPVVLGYAETEKWVHAQLRRLDTELWKSWQAIAPDALIRAPALGHEDFAQPAKPEDSVQPAEPEDSVQPAEPAVPFLHTAWIGFGTGKLALKIVPPDDSSAKPGRPLTLRVLSRPIGGKVDSRPALTMTTDGGDVIGEFVAEPGKVYAVAGSGPPQSARTWGIFARRA